MTTSTVKAPIEAGVWNIDPTHSTVGFVVKHLMVSKVRGSFKQFSGQITVGEAIEDSTVTASINGCRGSVLALVGARGGWNS